MIRLQKICHNTDNINYNVYYTLVLLFINGRKSEKRRLTILSKVGLLLSSFIMLVIIAAVVVVVMIIVLSSTSEALLLLPLSYAQQQEQNIATNSAACIRYDATENIITISCDSASLNDI